MLLRNTNAGGRGNQPDPLWQPIHWLRVGRGCCSRQRAVGRLLQSEVQQLWDLPQGAIGILGWCMQGRELFRVILEKLCARTCPRVIQQFPNVPCALPLGTSTVDWSADPTQTVVWGLRVLGFVVECTRTSPCVLRNWILPDQPGGRPLHHAWNLQCQ